MKTLAISIAAYNQEKWLDRCLASLIIPSIDELEVFVVNDGSKDRTSEIAHQWADKYPGSIFVIDKENAHYGSCCNASLPRATAKYFRLLDADDFFDSDELERYVAALRDTDTDMVITTHVICNTPPTIIMPGERLVGEKFDISEVNFRQDNLPRCYGMHGTTYRTKLLQETGLRLTERCCATDTEFAYFPLRHCKTVAFFDFKLYMYQTGIEGQDTSIVSPKQKDQRYEVAKRMIMDFIENPVPEGNIRDAQRIQISRILTGYYGIYICSFPNNPTDDARIKAMDELLLKHDRKIYDELDSVFECKVHFIRRYRHTGHTQRHLMRFMRWLRSLR